MIQLLYDNGSGCHLRTDKVIWPIAAGTAVCRDVALTPKSTTKKSSVICFGTSTRVEWFLPQAYFVVDAQAKFAAVGAGLQSEAVLGLAASNHFVGVGSLGSAAKAFGVPAVQLEVDDLDLRPIGPGVFSNDEVEDVDVL